MTRTYTLDPAPPVWLARIERNLAYDLPPEQLHAACQLLRLAAPPGVPDPWTTVVPYYATRLGSFRWILGRREVLAVPLWYDGRLHAELSFWRDGGDPVWSGWPAEPVAVLRSMLRWVYQGENT